MAIELSPRNPQELDRPDIGRPSEITASSTANLESLMTVPMVSASFTTSASSPTSTSAAATSPSLVTAAPSATSSSQSTSGSKVEKVVAIVVPIVAVVLLVPLIFLLYRSHQMKRAAARRQSQRSSTEAMLQRPSSISKAPPQIPQFKNLGPRKPPEGKSKGGFLRPANSLGLFNFDLSPSPSPRTSTPMTAMTSGVGSPSGIGSPPPRLSVAHAVPVRRSQASVIDARRPPTRHSDEVQQHTIANPSDPSQPSNPHFAPLEQIGTAHTRSPSRPNLRRMASDISAISRPSDEPLHPPDAYGRPYDPSAASSGYVPPIPSSGLDRGGRFTISDYNRTLQSDRHSDVSALTDDEEHDRRMSERSHIVSPVQDSGGTQPYRIL